MDPLPRSFFVAVWSHNVENARAFLASNVNFDVNTPDPTAMNRTVLHVACSEGDLPMVKYLLSLPGIDPNKPDGTGWTPLYNACVYFREEVVRELLVSVKGLEVNRKSETGCSPLRISWRRNSRAIIQQLLLYATNLEVPADKLVSRSNPPAMESLLNTFVKDPKKARTRIIIELGLQAEMIARLFVLVVLVCDEYLKEVRREEVLEGDEVEAEATANQRRFLRMMVALPMDVQTIICNMAFDSTAQFVLTKDSGPFFEEFIAEERLKRPKQTQEAPPRARWWRGGGFLSFDSGFPNDVN